MNFINNYVQLKYFEELAGLIVFSVILAGYGIWIAITYLRELFKSRQESHPFGMGFLPWRNSANQKGQSTSSECITASCD